MKTNYKVAVTLFAALGLCVVACGKKEHTHTYVEHEEVLSNCAETGTEFYYSCEGCELLFDEDYNEIEQPVSIPIDSTNHKGTEFLALSGTYKNEYQVGEAFDTTGIVLTAKCEHCEGRVLKEAEMERVTVTYPTANATAFTAEDLANEDLKVTLNYGTLHVDAPINDLRKKDNAITGLPEVIQQHCGYKPFASLDGVSATYGDIVYTFSKTDNDDDYKTAAELGEEFEFSNEGKGDDESTTYYVKATVAAGTDYAGVEEKTTIVITHNVLSWDTTRDDYDFFGCVCQEPYKFEKVPTHVDQKVDVASAALDLTGTSFDSSKDTVKSITLVDGEDVNFSLGTNLSNLDLSEVPAEHHGKVEVDVVVTSHQEGSIPEYDHTIKVNLLVVTKTISTVAELEALSTLANKKVYGYYLLGSDVNFAHTSDPQPTESAPGSEEYIGTGNGFYGTLDGQGHTISYANNACHNNGLFGTTCIGAVIKNINFTCLWYSGHSNESYIGYTMYGTTLENVSFAATTPATNLAKYGIYGIIAQFTGGNTFKNVSIVSAVAGGNNVLCSVVQGVNDSNGGGITSTYTECSITATKIYGIIGRDQVTEVDGWTINAEIYSA